MGWPRCCPSRTLLLLLLLMRSDCSFLFGCCCRFGTIDDDGGTMEAGSSWAGDGDEKRFDEL